MDFITDIHSFPTTRYQGIKRKLLPWIYNIIKDIEFHTVLDVFGGSASVSLLFKKMNKATTFNDILKFNSIIGESVIANNFYSLSKDDIDFLLDFSHILEKQGFIAWMFGGIYYLDDENQWLDNIIMRIKALNLLYSSME
ncbi:MAG: DNA adenine methylase, partial [Bacteroidales bacterium]|nr:DNA adenine methylase [Bacteroidales bacterium]